MKNIFIAILLLVPALVLFQGVGSGNAQRAASLVQFQYPIESLGYCDSEEDCQNYCNNIQNYQACLAFGISNRMYSPEREQVAVAVLDGDGPNDCRGPDCVDVCDAAAARNECVEFAADLGQLGPREYAVMLNVLEGGGPGGCVLSQECEDYCAIAANEQECIDYAIDAGLMAEQDRIRVERLRVDGPGGCQGERACALYCAVEEHVEECVLFAVEFELVAPEMAEFAASLHLDDLDGPGGCRGDRECSLYCMGVEHQQECLQYALDHGVEAAVDAVDPDRGQLINVVDRGRDNPERQNPNIREPAAPDYIMMMDPETGVEVRVYLEDLINAADRVFVHPVGCTTVDECRSYCDLPENRAECKPFAG